MTKADALQFTRVEKLISIAVARPMRDWVVGCASAMLLICAADIATPLSYSSALLYLSVVFAAGFTGHLRLIIGVTTGSIGLTLAGAAISALGWPDSATLANRAIIILVLALSGFVVRIASRQYAALYKRERQLDAVTSELEETEYLLKMSGRLASFGGWQVDPLTNELKLSDQLKIMLNFNQNGPLDIETVLQRFSPNDAARLLALVNRAIQTGEGFDAELKISRQNGQESWLRAIGEATFDSRTGQKVVQGALKDITKSKLATIEREAQQQHLQLLQTAIDQVDDLVLITKVSTDESGPHLVYVNDAFERLTGYHREEVIGKSPRLLQGPKTQQNTVARIREAIAAGQPILAELLNYTKTGREYWIEMQIMPVIRNDGDITHMVAIERDVTARKRQEDADRQQAQLTALSERLGEIGSWIATPSENKVIWSAGARKLMEWDEPSAPELESTLDFYKPAYREMAMAAVQACIDDGTPFNIEVEGYTGSGRAIWARVAGTPEFDESKMIAQVVGVVQDITPRKEMELARQAQELMLAERTAQLEEAQRIGNIGSWSYDFSTDRLTWTRQIYTIFGVEPADFTHDFSGLLAMIHVDDRPNIQSLWDAAHGAATRHTIIYRVVRPDGETRHVQQISEPAGESGGTRHAGTLQDVTRQVRDDLALRESEERFRLVTEVSADIIWDWNVRSGNIWWSDREPARFGCGMRQGSMTIDRWAKTIHADDKPAIETSLLSAMQGKAIEWSGQYRVVKADGSVADVSILAKMIRGGDGAVIRVVGSINDVTERLLLEAKLRSAYKLEAIGQLTGGIAHDFNNLLTVILGNAELLEDALQGQPALRKLASLSRSAAEKGGLLTSRLLSFARKQPLDPKPTDVAALITDMIPLLQSSLNPEIDLATRFEDALCRVRSDVSQLENALLNLCINARDAMPDGGRIIIEASNVVLDEDYCSRHPDALPGGYVLVDVTDTGAGMDTETKAKAFEPFFTTKPAGKGSGLGLSMVYGFAKQSRGHVRIYSEIGHGTSVQLFLPRANPLADDARAQPTEKSVGGDEEILLVEDDVMVRDHAYNLLSQLGYSVTAVENGPAAIATLQKADTFDLLFTDVMMPGGMNGRQLADAARALRPSLPVLFTSGYAENAIVHNGQLDPGVHFLHKPYRKAEIAQKVREALAAGNLQEIAESL